MKIDNPSSWSGHILELDGLRGVASLLVLFHHFWPTEPGGLQKVANVAHLGWIGVDLFFVISGFLIGGILLDTAGRKDYYLTFYVRRALRIFPLYYLFLTVLFVVIPLAQKGAYLTTAFVRESGHPLWYFLYLGNIREALTNHEPAYFLAPLWSLSIEEQFYLTFPLFVAVLNRKHLRLLLCALILMAPLLRFLSLVWFPRSERIQYLATPCRMDVIALGVLIALEFRSGTFVRAKRYASACLLVLLIGLAIAFRLGGLDRLQPFCRIAGYSLVAFTFSAFVLWTVLHRGLVATAFLRFPAFTRIGKLCYGVYLLQRPTEVAFLKVLSHWHLSSGASPLLLMFGKIVSTVLVASISWYLFESRILQAKKYFAERSSRWKLGLVREPSLADS